MGLGTCVLIRSLNPLWLNSGKAFARFFMDWPPKSLLSGTVDIVGREFNTLQTNQRRWLRWNNDSVHLRCGNTSTYILPRRTYHPYLLLIWLGLIRWFILVLRHTKFAHWDIGASWIFLTDHKNSLNQNHSKRKVREHASPHF